MSTTIKRDADNKWFFGIDWSDFMDLIVEKYGGTATITASSWSIPATWTEEPETTFDAATNITTLVGSGGTNGTLQNVTNTITYSVSTLSLTDATQSMTEKVRLTDQ